MAFSALSPKTLLEWRVQQNQPEGAYPREMWTPLEPFFLSHGYTLWIQLGPKGGDAMSLRAQTTHHAHRILSSIQLNTLQLHSHIEGTSSYRKSVSIYVSFLC